MATKRKGSKRKYRRRRLPRIIQINTADVNFWGLIVDIGIFIVVTFEGFLMLADWLSR